VHRPLPSLQDIYHPEAPQHPSYVFPFLFPPLSCVPRLYGGQVRMALALGAAAVGAVLLLQPTRPRLSEISSLCFGSLYCGFLATYWGQGTALSVSEAPSTVVRDLGFRVQGFHTLHFKI